jgi:hypothetical protein
MAAVSDALFGEVDKLNKKHSHEEKFEAAENSSHTTLKEDEELPTITGNTKNDDIKIEMKNAHKHEEYVEEEELIHPIQTFILKEVGEEGSTSTTPTPAFSVKYNFEEVRTCSLFY